jgi:hypothetical protein
MPNVELRRTDNPCFNLALFILCAQLNLQFTLKTPHHGKHFAHRPGR